MSAPRTLLAIAAVALSVPFASAQAHVDFSGKWVHVDPQRADSLFAVGLSDVPGGGSITIVQNEKTITITRELPADLLARYVKIMGGFLTTTVHKLDGSESSNVLIIDPPPQPPGRGRTPAMDHEQPTKIETVSRATWKGDQLVIAWPILDGKGKAHGETRVAYSLSGQELRREATADRTDAKGNAIPSNVTVELFKRAQ
jgi:hypothetical protein